MGAWQAAGQHHGLQQSGVHLLGVHVRLDADAVGACDLPAGDAGQLDRKPGPAHHVHRGQGLYLFKAFR